MSKLYSAKVIFFFMFMLGIIVVGIIMFLNINENKRALQANLYSIVPADVSSIIQINNNKKIDDLSILLEGMDTIASQLTSYITPPLSIIEYEGETYMIAKTTPKQEIAITNILTDKIYSFYPPKERIYKNTGLLFFRTKENLFFVCMFYKGFFVGGYDFKLLEHIIDTSINNQNTISESPYGIEIIKRIKNHYPANLFVNNNISFSVFNIDLENEDNKVSLEGYDTSIISNDWVCGEDSKPTISIDYTIFPNSIDSYYIDMYNPHISDTLKCYFSPPSYSFQIHGENDKLYALKHIDNKFVVYNLLNDIEVEYINKRFDINDFFESYRIYTTSKQMGQDIFQFKDRAYMTFYKDYLIFSENKEVLKKYIRQNGKYNNKQLLENMEEENIISIFYSANLGNWYPDFFMLNNCISRNLSENVYIVSTIENKTRKIKMYLNN